MKLTSIVTACLLLTSSITFAQDEDKTQLDDITIEGGKLDKTLQETVSSIQVFDEQSIENSSSLNDMYDLFTQTSNVNRAGRYAFNIRGISATGVTGNYIGPRTINVSVDGVSLGSNASKQGAISTWDMMQAEIIKGPQSTVQGRNSLAGAITLKTKDPEFDANGAAQAALSSNAYQLSAMQTGAISEDLAIRLTVDKQYRDGFINNDDIDGKKFNDRDVLNARAKVLYNIDDESSLLFTLGKLKHEEGGNTESTYDRESVWNSGGSYKTDAESLSIEYDKTFNSNWDFKSISSYAREDLRRLSDFDDLDGDAVINIDREQEDFSQEFRLNYQTDNSKSIFGLYYTRGDVYDDQNISDYNASSDLGVPGLIIDYQNYLTEEYNNTALFFNSDYYVNDDLTLIFGARIDKDKRDNSITVSAQRLTNYGAGVNAAIDASLAALADGSIESSNTTTNFMPKIGFNYKLNENINTGFVYSKGYRPGGMSVNPVTAVATKYEAEFTDNLELSFKSQFFEKRLTFNTNLFYTIWKDQQVTEDGSTVSPFDVNIVNAGRSILKGIEIDSKFILSNEIDIYTSLAYTQARYKDYIDGSDDYSGNYLIKTPKITANLGANYRNDRGYFLGGNISYMGSQYGDSANTRKIDSYSIINVKTGYEASDYSIYVYANNLFDKNYVLNNYGDDLYEMGEQRVVGLNFKYYW